MTTTPDDTIRSLIRRLTEGTLQGTVRWDATSAASFELESTIGKITVWSQNSDNSHPFVFRLTNAQGVAIAELETLVGQSYAAWENEVANLYSAARNSALGVNSVVDELSKELGLPPDPNDVPF